ncbi:uncharacterized protein LOC129777621 [Toxorhynchites rutilus septentrionalis]|uniref:uncharacterized protein LOC129777621 n=1 Tax=Toxorhynchites rutilus septentrionalis TaxID=329112 RepID=UPI00247999EA|nr:uncharacterized protein LOC129777621 [Toxorhynchites rutilus septentrionalis]XP_055639982.1 uncharacterized protein LOC129777621 [Toxorhynchites rutilus septentrionalis]
MDKQNEPSTVGTKRATAKDKPVATVTTKCKAKAGDEFIPPDGGWGWVIVLAAGCSNLCTFPVIQQFGLLFRERMNQLGINSSEITTLINTNSALLSIVGLANGPMFRRFTYRQIAFFGSSLVALALCLTSMANSFTMYLILYSILYGSGVGITASANSLALNTYFREKRRHATGFSWTVTALGPIIAPHIITYLLPRFDVSGTVLIFAGFAMNAVACSLLLQPVEWHAKSANPTITNEADVEPTSLCQYCQSHPLRKDHSALSSQYLYNADNNCATGYEIIDPGTPMLSRANDGWYSSNAARSHYGSRMNLTSASRLTSTRPSYANLAESSKRALDEEAPTTPLADRGATGGFCRRGRSNTFNREKELLKMASSKLEQIVDPEITCCRCTCTETEPKIPPDEEIQENPTGFSFLQKIVIFFDLDLLKDYIYVNIMVGITLANFAELNFSILTPFVLGDFGLSKEQIALAMSLLGAMDILSRFAIPFLAGMIGWENRTFFLFGVMNMALGRVVLAHFHSYPAVLATACWIGLNKGLRTVFMALAIPSHVPLERLPGATGIQLLFSGVFCLVVGPIVGLIRDHTNYTVTLHCLNIATYLTALSWGLERFCAGSKRTQEEERNSQEQKQLLTQKPLIK